MYENVQLWKYKTMEIYMLKNINVKNVWKESKYIYIYMKNYKVTSNGNVNKETNQTKQNIWK